MAISRNFCKEYKQPGYVHMKLSLYIYYKIVQKIGIKNDKPNSTQLV